MLIRFYRIYIEITLACENIRFSSLFVSWNNTFRTQCDKESVYMKIKVSKLKLNIHYRGSPRGSRTQQHAYCLRYAHSQHIESHLSKKQQQAKILIAFFFGQLHFNNITSHALFYGGHLVMRSKRCAVQNQGITLRVDFCSMHV